MEHSIPTSCYIAFLSLGKIRLWSSSRSGPPALGRMAVWRLCRSAMLATRMPFDWGHQRPNMCRPKLSWKLTKNTRWNMKNIWKWPQNDSFLLTVSGGRQCPSSVCSKPLCPSAVALKAPGLPSFISGLLSLGSKRGFRGNTSTLQSLQNG